MTNDNTLKDTSADIILKTTAKVAGRERERLEKAWDQFAENGKCPYCPHYLHQHGVDYKQPHIFAQDSDLLKRGLPIMGTLYYIERPDGSRIHLRKLILQGRVAITFAACGRCAQELDVRQVVCFIRTWGVGEMLGSDAEDNMDTRSEKL